MTDPTIPAGWHRIKLPYRISYAPPIYGRGRADETWSLDALDAGYGLRCYPTAERAEAEAERLFGPPPSVIFTIKLLPSRTQVHVESAEGVQPEGALLAAIGALEAERAALVSCPMHTPTLSAPTTPDEGEEELRSEIARLRGLLINPGDPAWEDARAVLVGELRKIGFDTHADNVAAGHGVMIPSYVALDLIAHSRRPSEGEGLREALVNLLAWAETIEDKTLVGDEGCLWPVEAARAALKGER